MLLKDYIASCEVTYGKMTPNASFSSYTFENDLLRAVLYINIPEKKGNDKSIFNQLVADYSKIRNELKWKPDLPLRVDERIVISDSEIKYFESLALRLGFPQKKIDEITVSWNQKICEIFVNLIVNEWFLENRSATRALCSSEYKERLRNFIKGSGFERDRNSTEKTEYSETFADIKRRVAASEMLNLIATQKN